MKKVLICLLNSIAIMGLWSCGDDEEPEPVPTPEPETTLTVNLFEINLDEKDGSSQKLTISSSEQWNMTGIPDWINVSATSGSGTSTINISSNSFNNSSSERTATLKISISDKGCDVVVKQKAGLIADCAVTPDISVILADGYACNWKCGSKVSYFYKCMFRKAKSEQYTENEIIEIMLEETDRVSSVDSKGNTIYWSGLEPESQYVVYSVAFDKNGKQGELVKTEFTTKSAYYQAEAYVESITYNDSYFYWDTTIGGYCSKYYMLALMGSDFESAGFNEGDVYLAWLIKYYINEGSSPLTPIVQNGSWKAARASTDIAIQIITWGIGAEGNYAGTINRAYEWVDESTKSVKSQNTMGQGVKHQGIRNYSEDLKKIQVIRGY